jgi:hypothetical protein
MCSASIWCPYLLIHDDQIGAYLQVAFGPPNPQSNRKPSLIVNETDSLVSRYKEEIVWWYEDAYLECIIVPLPPRHVMAPDAAANKGKAILTEAYALYAKSQGVKDACASYLPHLSNSIKRIQG